MYLATSGFGLALLDKRKKQQDKSNTSIWKLSSANFFGFGLKKTTVFSGLPECPFIAFTRPHGHGQYNGRFIKSTWSSCWSWFCSAVCTPAGFGTFFEWRRDDDFFLWFMLVAPWRIFWLWNRFRLPSLLRFLVGLVLLPIFISCWHSAFWHVFPKNMLCQQRFA